MTSESVLDRARTDYTGHRWAAAVAGFEQVGGFDSLMPEDAERLAWSVVWTGPPAVRCLDVFERVERVCRRAGDRRAAARAALEQARMHALVGNDEVSVSCWVRGVEYLEGGGECAEHGMAHALAAYAQLVAGEPGGAMELARSALDLGRRVGNVTVTALSRYVVGQVEVLDGDVEDGLAQLDGSISLATSHDVHPMYAGTIHCGVLWTCRQTGDWSRARGWHEVASRWCDRAGVVHFPAHLHVHRAELLRVRGRLEDARDAAVAALELAADWSSDLTGWAHYQVGACRLSQGDLAGAEAAFARADELGHAPEPGRSRLLLAQGHPEAAWHAITTAIEDPHWYALSSLLHTLPTGIAVALALGRIDDAVEWSERLVELADRFRTDASRAAAETARGAITLARRDATRAVAQLHVAVGRWQAAEAPLDAARTRVLLGRAYWADGHADTAHRELEAARTVFLRHHARWEAERVTAVLAGTDGPSALNTVGRQQAIDVLTPRQREVAALVARGQTNQQIADDLVISRYTAETHVKHILARLGMDSRTEVAVWASEHGLTDHE